MIFIRLVVSHTRDCVCAVSAQDTPFENGGGAQADGEVCEVFDLGLIEDTDAGGREIDWRDRDSISSRPCRHILHRLEDLGLGAQELLAHAVVPSRPDPRPHPLAAALGVRDIIDVPCTIDGIRARLRQHGHRSISAKVRAWLAMTLSDRHRDAMALGGIPLAALKAMEKIRNRRDPGGGSRLSFIERLIQQASDERAARDLARRQAKGR